MDRLEGRVAVVTGAASGIGFALAERFAREGMRVVLADVEADPLAAAARSLGGGALAVRTDVGDPDQVEALAAAAVERFGAVHLLCNNAGVAAGGLVADVPLADWEWVLRVNLMGVVHGLRSFLRVLSAQEEAHVVNTASVAGLVAPPFVGPYTASKFAVVGLSETLAAELVLQGSRVGVSVLCPAWVRTRIADADRNRPGGPVAAEGAAAALRQGLRDVVAGGLPPAEVARHVVDAVRTRRFYVLTHPESVRAVERRLEAVRAGGAPPPVVSLP